MEIDKSLLHSATLTKNGTIYYFDDIGCMILWSRENNIDTSTAKVFSNDTHKYVDAVIANYTIGQRDKLGIALGVPVYVYKIANILLNLIPLF